MPFTPETVHITTMMTLPTRTTTPGGRDPLPSSSSLPGKLPIPKRPANKAKLQASFVPGKYSVICGRGKLCTASSGNKHLRSLVNDNLDLYSAAKNKNDKSAIVSSIINAIREVSPEGSFVKQDENGCWWEVEDSFAREKIGCIFRDILHTQYKSSTKAKLARKKADKQDTTSINKNKRVALSTSNKKGAHHRTKNYYEPVVLEGSGDSTIYNAVANHRRLDIDRLVGSGVLPRQQRFHTMMMTAGGTKQSNQQRQGQHQDPSFGGFREMLEMTSPNSYHTQNSHNHGVLAASGGGHPSSSKARSTSNLLVGMTQHYQCLSPSYCHQGHSLHSTVSNTVRRADSSCLLPVSCPVETLSDARRVRRPPPSWNRSHALLQGACDIIMGHNSNFVEEQQDEFPDDLSDIFEA